MIRLPGSIRFNLFLVVLAGVLPVMIVVLVSGWERRQHEIDEARLTTSRLASYLAFQQEAETARLRDILVAVSRYPAVRDLDVGGSGQVLRDLLIANPNYTNFLLVGRDGRTLASALPFQSHDVSQALEFREALRTGAFSVGAYTEGRLSKTQILPFALPFRDAADRIGGVLIATLRVSDFGLLFDNTQLPPDSFVGMADRSGRRLYRYPRREGAVVGEPITAGVWRRVETLGKSALFTETSVDGVRRIYAVNRVGLEGGTPYLNIFVGIPERVVLARADAITRRSLAWLAGSLALSLTLAWLIGKYGIHARLECVARTAERIGAGNLSARCGLVAGTGSLGLLARSVDRMARDLEADRAALDKANAGRDLEIQRRAALMDISADGIVVINRKHRVLEANRSFAEMLGRDPAEVVGLRTWDYVGQMSEADIRARFGATCQVRATLEVMLRRRDGSLVPVEVSARGNVILGVPLVIAVVRDIAERKQAERALQESEERYRTLFESSLDAIAVFEDLPPRITWVNQAFCKLFGHEAEAVYAMSAEAVWDMVHPEDREAVRQSVLARLAGERDTARQRYRIVRGDRTCRWVDVTGRQVGGDKRMNISIYRDMTEEHEAGELLARAKVQAEDASRAKSEFLANMSHELRTPLTGILGMLQVMLEGGLSEEQAGYARLAVQSGRRLTRLLSDILDISKIEAGKLVVIREPFDIRRAVAEVHALSLPLAAQSGLDCPVEIDPRIPDILVGDGPRLQQVLTNLVGNALKFTKQGQVGIELTLLPPGRGRTRRILFAVRDTGVGIAESVLSGLFEPFTQGSQGYRRGHQGAGLGLSICKRLVGLMGGGITVESEVGVGTAIYFALPFELPAAAPAAGPLAANGDAPKGVRVLLVEDDAVTQLATRFLLVKKGCAVAVAGDGRAALDLLAERDFDLVLMDVQMPVMDGVEATRRIRDGEAGRDRARIPIIAMTAYAMASDRERLLRAGMDGYLAKPVDLRELWAVIAEVLASRPGDGRSSPPTA